MADVEQASGTSSESAGKRSRNFFLKQPLNVLLVEDDAVTLQVIERLLRKCDYQGEDQSCSHCRQTHCPTPFEASAVLQSQQPEMGARRCRFCSLSRAAASTWC